MHARDKLIVYHDDIEKWLGTIRDRMRKVVVGGDGEVFSVHSREEALHYYEGACALIRYIKDVVDER